MTGPLTMVRVFTNGPEDWGSLSGQVIPKIFLNGTWYLLCYIMTVGMDFGFVLDDTVCFEKLSRCD